MAIRTHGPTLAEFLELPERKPALEFEAGRVTRKVSPQADHGVIQAEIAFLLRSRLGTGRLGRVFTELRTTFADTSRVPDLAIYRWDRLPRDEHGRIGGRVFTPPDVAIEIRSPQQSVAAQLRRCREYVAHGVLVALMVDPIAEDVWLLPGNGAEERLRGEQSVDLSAIFAGLVFTPAEIFSALRAD